jgi:opacity protein-like surface antigen
VESGTRELFGKQSAPSEQTLELRPRTYGMNLTENRSDRLFNGTFKTDPRLIMGMQIAPNWSLEAGYANLFDRGFHRIDERDARDTAGALGINGFNTHAAVKYTVPVTGRLTAYGKLGVAYSEMGGRQNRPGETGMYKGIGARYKVNDRMTVGVEYGDYGGAVNRSNNSNSNSVKVEVGISF